MESFNENSNSTKEMTQESQNKKSTDKDSRQSKDNKDRIKSPEPPKESLREQKELLKDERAKLRVERSGHQNARVKLGWKSDLNKDVIIQNFTDRFWEEIEDEDNWNFFWASVNTIRQIFSGKSYVKLTDYQILNHFPNFYELTRKDLMAKNIKKYKRQLLKEGSPVDHLDFLPLTFVLPQDMYIFIEEFKKYPNSLWILKPNNRCQGQGITLLNKTSKVKKMSFSKKVTTENNQTVNINDIYVVSKYIDNPFLMGGKKFDLRIYCLVTTFRPLKAYLYQQGFCRFCNEKFSVDVSDINNIYMHLTNVAIQKKYEKYQKSNGGKFSLQNLHFYLENVYGYERAKKCNQDITQVIIGSLLSVQNVMFNDKHCFELYGYDILIDQNLKPWLIEINSSPSLSTTTKGDFILKKRLINDTIDIVITDKWLDEKGKPGASSFTGKSQGLFDLIYDGSETKEEKKAKEVFGVKGRYSKNVMKNISKKV
jgi:tubulin polyglutamylase TTLL1